MKTVSLGNVGLSLIGLYALAQGLVLFPLLATRSLALLDVGRQGFLLVAVVTVLPFGLLMLLGAILLVSPARIASKIWPGSDDIPAVSEELALLVFAATGVVVFARALPDLIDTAIVVLLTGRTAEARPGPSGTARASSAWIDTLLPATRGAPILARETAWVRRQRRCGRRCLTTACGRRSEPAACARSVRRRRGASYEPPSHFLRSRDCHRARSSHSSPDQGSVPVACKRQHRAPWRSIPDSVTPLTGGPPNENGRAGRPHLQHDPVAHSLGGTPFPR